MWEISVYTHGHLQVHRFADHDELAVSNLWSRVKHLEHASCRRATSDGSLVLGTKRASDPLVWPGAFLITCHACDKVAWSLDPNQLMCLGCEVTHEPNIPAEPRGMECISETGYHVLGPPDALGIRRCAECCCHVLAFA